MEFMSDQYKARTFMRRLQRRDDCFYLTNEVRYNEAYPYDYEINMDEFKFF